jgi:hypothetical protein
MSTRLTGTIREKTRLTGSLGVATITTFGDATALASDITAGETAYIATGKVTGTYVPLDTSDATAAESDLLSGKTAYADGEKLTGTCTFDADTSDATAAEGDIRTGTSAYVDGVKLDGSLTPLDTSSATATASDILTGKTAYISDGTEATGTCDFNADTTDATAVEDSLLYGHTAYGSAGTKLMGTGAYWQGITAFYTEWAFSPTSLPANVIMYCPLATSIRNLFSGCTSPQTINLTFGTLVAGYTLSGTFMGCTGLTTLTFTGVTSGMTTPSNAFLGCTSLETINGTLNFTASTNLNNFFKNCIALVTVTFAPSTLGCALSMVNSSLLSTTSLLSVANGLDAGRVNTLTMHDTSKTNMTNLMVDNVDGVAVAGSAMTLMAFIQNVKGWTVA